MYVPIEVLLLFIPVTAIAAVSPGPDVLYIASRSFGNSFINAFLASAGVATGLLVHTVAIAFGLGQLFDNVPAAYGLLKYIGAVYLLYLAYKAFTAKSIPSEIERKEVSKRDLFKVYYQGFFTNILNPKALMFFVAFLPPFVDVQAGHVREQLFILALTSACVAFVCHSGIGLSVSALSNFIKAKASQKLIRAQSVLLGSLFGFLAFKLATSSNS